MRRAAALLAMAVAACSPTSTNPSPSALSVPKSPAPASSPVASDDDFMDIPGLGRLRVDVPRPSGPSPATCEPLAAGPADGQTTEQRVEALRAMGFFAGRTGTDAEIARAIDEAAKSEFGEIPSPTDPLSELVVAQADEARAWWFDLEADVDQANTVYETIIEEWGAISVGAFTPTGIEETWEAAEGPVSVSMTLGGRVLELKPAYLEDWIDPRILTPINEAIATSGRQFEPYRDFDQTLFLVALTPDEKRALEAERGWCFEWPSSG